MSAPSPNDSPRTIGPAWVSPRLVRFCAGSRCAGYCRSMWCLQSSGKLGHCRTGRRIILSAQGPIGQTACCNRWTAQRACSRNRAAACSEGFVASQGSATSDGSNSLRKTTNRGSPNGGLLGPTVEPVGPRRDGRASVLGTVPRRPGCGRRRRFGRYTTAACTRHHGQTGGGAHHCGVSLDAPRGAGAIRRTQLD